MHDRVHPLLLVLAALVGGLAMPPAVMAAPNLECSIDSEVNGTEVTLTMTVQNTGDTEAVNQGLYVGLLFRHLGNAPNMDGGDVPDAFLTFNTLPASASLTKSDTFQAIPGSYKAWCLVNPEVLGEKPVLDAPANVTSSYDYVVEEPPPATVDLVVEALEEDTEDGLTFSFSVTVKNQGDADAPSFDVDVYGNSASQPAFDNLGDVYCQFPTGLPAGESATVDCANSYTVPTPGDYTAWAYVDWTALVEELGEGAEDNNIFSLNYTAGPADLSITAIVVTTDQSDVTYAVTVANQGGLQAKNVDVCLYYDSVDAPTGEPDEIKSLGSLPIGPGFELEFQRQGAPNGDFKAWALADCNNTLVEADDENNGLSQAYTVQGPPNEPPTLDSVEGPDVCHEATLCQWTSVATDTTLLPLTFRIVDGPKGMWADPSTGTVYYVPPLGSTAPGQSATVEVKDGGGLVSSESIEFLVLPVEGFDGVVGAVGAMPIGSNQNACAMVEVEGSGFAHVRPSDYTVAFFDHSGKATGAIDGATEIIVGKDHPIQEPQLSCHVEMLTRGGIALLELNTSTVLIYGTNGHLLRKIELLGLTSSLVQTDLLLSEQFIAVDGQSLAFYDLLNERILVVDSETGALNTSWGGNTEHIAGTGDAGILDLYDATTSGFYPYEGYLWSDGSVIRIYNSFYQKQHLIDYEMSGLISTTIPIGDYVPCGGLQSDPCPDPDVFPWVLRAAPDGGLQFLDTVSAALHWYDSQSDEMGAVSFVPHSSFTLSDPNPVPGEVWPAGWVSLQAYGLSANNLACEPLGAGGFTCHDRTEERGFVIDPFGEYWANCPNLDVSPNALEFGGVPAGLKKTTSVVIANKNGGVLYITDLQLVAGEDSLGIFSIPALEDSVLLYPGEIMKFDVTYSPPGPGTYEATVVLSANACVPLTVKITGHSGPRINVSPNPITFSGVTIGTAEPHQRAVTVRNVGSDDLNVSNISLQQTFNIFSMLPANIPVQVLKSGESIELSIVYPANAAGEVSGILRVQSSDPNDGLLEVDIIANTAAQVQAKPTGFSFGSLSIGESQTQWVEFTNLGFTAADIAEVKLSGPPGFTVETSLWNSQLGPGGFSMLGLTYTALVPGTVTALVTLVPSDPTVSPLYLSAVAGTGTQFTPGFSGVIPMSGSGGAFAQAVGVDKTLVELNAGGFAAYGHTSQAIHVLTSDGSPNPWFGVNGVLQIAGEGGVYPQATGLGDTLVEMTGSGFAMLSNDAPIIYTVTPTGSPNHFVGDGGVISLVEAFSSPSLANVGDTLIQLPNHNFAFISRDTYADVGSGATLDKLLLVRPDGIPDVGVNGNGEIILGGAQAEFGNGLAEGVGASLLVSPTGGVVFGDTTTGTFYVLSGTGAFMNSSKVDEISILDGALISMGSPKALFYNVPNGILTGLAFDGSVLKLNPEFGGNGTIVLGTVWPDATPGAGAIGLMDGTGAAVTEPANDRLLFVTNSAEPMVIQPSFGAVVPASISFANVPVGKTSAPKGFDITNTGTYPLHVQVSITSPTFHLSSGASSMVVQPGTTEALQLVFAPNAIGIATATMTVSSNDPEQTSNHTVALEGRTGPHLVISPNTPIIDFGSVKKGLQFERLVFLTNDGTDVLSLGSITLQGSNQFQIVTNPANATIDAPDPPGSTPPVKQLKIRYSPSQSGLHTAVVTISHDDPAGGQTVFTIQGRSGSQLTLTPDSLLCAGLSLGQPSLCGTVLIGNSGTVPLTVGDIAVEGDGFEVIAESAILAPGGEPLQAIVTVTPQSVGNSTGTLSILHDDPASGPVTTLPLTAIARSNVALSPSLLDFGAVPLGGSVSSTIFVTVPPGAPSANVLAATVVGDGAIQLATALTLPMTVSSENSFEVPIRCAPTSNGVAESILTVATDSLGATTLTATIRCVTGPQLSADPTQLNFGAVVVNESKYLPLSVTHTGTGTLTYSAPSIAGSSAFKVVEGEAQTLMPGETTSLVIRFQPGQEQPYSANNNAVKFASSGTGKPLLFVPLSGTSGPSVEIQAATNPLDFGALGMGESQSKQVNVVNSGSTALVLDDFSIAFSSGSFSIVDKPSGSIALDPGENRFFTLLFSPVSIGEYNGQFNVSGPLASAALSLTGRVGGVLRVNPEHLAFGEVSLGSTKSLPVLIDNQSDSIPLTVYAVQGGDKSAFVLDGFSVDGQSLAPGEKLQDVWVHFSPNTLGDYDSTITFYTDKGVPSDSIDVKLTGNSGANARVVYPNAGFLNFRNVQVGTEATQPVHVAALYPAAASILGFSITGATEAFSIDGLLDLPHSIPSGEVAELLVRCVPPEAGVYEGNLSLQTNGQFANGQSIRLRCETSTKVVTSPGQLAFGTVLPYTEHTQAVTVKNEGLEVVVVQQASVTNQGDTTGFSLAQAAPSNYLLFPGDVLAVPVLLSPDDVGLFEGTLHIQTSDPVMSDIAIALRAHAGAHLDIQPPILNFCANTTEMNLAFVNVGATPVDLTDIALLDSQAGGVNLIWPGGNQPGEGEPPPYTLTPDQSEQMTLTYGALTGSNVAHQSLVITSNDAATPSGEVRLIKGKGLVFDNQFTGTADVAPPTTAFASAFETAGTIGVSVAELCTGGFVLASLNPHELLFMYPALMDGALALEAWGRASARVDLTDVVASAGLDPNQATDLGAILTTLDDGTIVLGSAAMATYVFLRSDGHIARDRGQNGLLRLDNVVEEPGSVGGAIAARGAGFVVVDRTRRRLIGLDSDGSIDTTLGEEGVIVLDDLELPAPVGNTVGESLLVLSTGSIAVSDGVNDTIIVLKPDGSLDDGFGDGGVISLRTVDLSGKPLQTTGPGIAVHGSGFAVTDQATGRIAFVYDGGETNISVAEQGISQVTGVTGLYAQSTSMSGALVRVRHAATESNQGTLVVVDNVGNDLLFINATDGSGLSKELAELSMQCPLVIDDVDPDGSKTLQGVTITNTGDTFLKLSAPSTDAVGVTSANVVCTGEGFTCAAGTTLGATESTAMALEWSPNGKPGCFDENVIIHHDGVNGPVTTCPLYLRTKAVFESIPAAPSYDFPSQAVGASYKREFIVRNTGCAPMQLDDLFLSTTTEFILDKGVSAGGDVPLLQPGDAHKFWVTCQPTKKGAHTTVLQFSVQNMDPPDAVILNCISGPLLEVSTKQLSWGSVDVGGVQSKSIKLTSAGGEAVVIDLEGVLITGTGAEAFAIPVESFKETLPPGHSMTVSVLFAPTDVGEFDASLQIASNSYEPAVVELNGLTAPDALFDANPVDFGYVASGTEKIVTVSVDNIGAGYLSLDPDSSVLDDTPFSCIQCQELLVAPGSPATIKLSCNPTESGEYSASLVFETNAQGAVDGQLALALECRSGGAIAVTPTSLDWGTVQSDDEPTTRFATVRNDGSDPISVTVGALAVSPDTGELTFDSPLNFSVDPNGGEEQIVVLLTPAAHDHSITGHFVVQSDALNAAVEGIQVGLEAVVSHQTQPETGDNVDNPEQSTVEGSGDDAGSGTELKPAPARSETGCGCRTTPPGRSNTPLGGFVLLSLALLGAVILRRRDHATDYR